MDCERLFSWLAWAVDKRTQKRSIDVIESLAHLHHAALHGKVTLSDEEVGGMSWHC